MELLMEMIKAAYDVPFGWIMVFMVVAMFISAVAAGVVVLIRRYWGTYNSRQNRKTMKENCKTIGDLLPKYGMLETTIDRRYKITADIFIQQGTIRLRQSATRKTLKALLGQ